MQTLLPGALAQSGPGGIPPPVIAFGIIAILIVVGIIVSVQAGKRRRAAIAASLGAAGWTVHAEPDPASKDRVIGMLADLSDRLRQGARGLRWFAVTSRDGFDLVLLEHVHSTGTGKNRTTVYNSVVAVACPMNWARVSLTPESLFTRLGKHLGLKDLDLENAAFNRRWRVQAEDENFALAVLGPGVQEVLAAHPAPTTGKLWSQETWRIGRGCVAVLLQRSVRVEELPAMADRLISVLQAMDPALQEMMEQSTFGGIDDLKKHNPAVAGLA